jgi:hypothetical protein
MPDQTTVSIYEYRFEGGPYDGVTKAVRNVSMTSRHFSVRSYDTNIQLGVVFQNPGMSRCQTTPQFTFVGPNVKKSP